MKTKIITLITVMFFALMICNVSSAAGTNYTNFTNETMGANAITLDSEGNVYITGTTTNANFTVTNGTYTSSIRGGNEMFISKYTSNGTLIFSTIIGGNGTDIGYGITVDNQKNIYITGQTNSINFPTTTGASLTGGSDAFIVKLNADGSKLLYSTYFGGNSTAASGGNAELGYQIAVDKYGNTYIIGHTNSDYFPTTPNAYKTSITSNSGTYWGDAFLTKFNSNWELVYSTLLGGNIEDDNPYGIVIDSQNNIWITGKTSSEDFPITTGAYQTTRKGTADGFISKIVPNGNGSNDLLYSTYFGGTGNDYGYAIAIDSTDNIYITGQTTSTNFPYTIGAYQTTRKGSGDAYIAKFNSSGSLIYSTYFGGSSTEDARAITVDNQGNVYITGRTGGVTPITANAIQKSIQGGWDSFVAKLDLNTNTLLYGSLLGGKGSDLGTCIAVDDLCNVYVAGTFSMIKIATAPTVNINQTGGIFKTNQSVTLTTPDSTTTIYYTTDGSDPKTSSTRSVYTDPIIINTTTTLKYAALDDLSNWSPVHTEIYNLCDVYVIITSSNPNPKVGDNVRYTFKLGNKGPSIAKDIVFTYVIPEGLEYVYADKDQGTVSYNEPTRTLTWTLGDVAVGDPYLWLELNALSAGNFNINPTVTVSGNDIGSDGNIASLLINVLSASTNTTDNENTVNAASETSTVPMQTTGVPISGLIMALLMVGSGLALSRKK